MQMGGAPEIAAHLERMQPASAPPSRLLRPAAVAGALMKPSERSQLSLTVHSSCERDYLHVLPTCAIVCHARA